jgi:hypothetical protein
LFVFPPKGGGAREWNKKQGGWRLKPYQVGGPPEIILEWGTGGGGKFEDWTEYSQSLKLMVSFLHQSGEEGGRNLSVKNGEESS